jgi:DNA-binding NarL/FixJ family response regulator
MTEPTRAIIAAAPGRIRESWQALLRAIPRINTIQLADDQPSALQIVTDQQPGLVLLDSKLTDSLPDMLRQIKTGSPQTHCIVLVDTFEQQWLAKNTGADSVLLAGTSAEMFFAIVEGVLSWPSAATHQTNNKSAWSSHDQKDHKTGANNERYP